MIKPKMISIIILFTLLFTSCNVDRAPFSPKAKNNKQVIEYVDILRTEFPLIKNQLEVLRNGKVGNDGYTLRIADNDADIEDIFIYIYENVDTIDDLLLLSNNEYNLPQNEIDSIKFLFNSEELRANARYIEYGRSAWQYGIGTQGAQFFETNAPYFNIGIYYFENNEIPEELQNSKEYTEELEDNYWIVACNVQKV